MLAIWKKRRKKSWNAVDEGPTFMKDSTFSGMHSKSIHSSDEEKDQNVINKTFENIFVSAQDATDKRKQIDTFQPIEKVDSNEIWKAPSC